MQNQLRILHVEDSNDDAALIQNEFKRAGVPVQWTRVETEEEFRKALAQEWSLILCDNSLPTFSSREALEILRAEKVETPCLIVSGSVGEENAIQVMKSGASDFIHKDRLSRLVPAVAREIEEYNRRRQLKLLETELQESQLTVRRLKRFFPPTIAEHVLSGKIEDPFTWHRNDVTVLFIDLRGFTDFSEAAEPEDVMVTLSDYYKTVAHAAHRYGGSVGHLAGDGIMIFFNDPVPLKDPGGAAVQMALETKESLIKLCESWGHMDFTLNFGIGIASGYATIGGIGTDGCWDYTVIGTVTNLAARLCSEARNGQILVSRRFLTPLNDRFKAQEIGDIAFKGLRIPVRVYNIEGSNEDPSNSIPA